MVTPQAWFLIPADIVCTGRLIYVAINHSQMKRIPYMALSTNAFVSFYGGEKEHKNIQVPLFLNKSSILVKIVFKTFLSPCL